MNSIVTSLRLITLRKDSRSILIIASCVFLSLLFIFENGKNAFAVLTFDSLPGTTRLFLFVKTLFDVKDSFTASALILALAGSLLGGINLSLAYTYMKLRGEVLLKSGLYSGVALLIAFLGVGCAACGTALLGVLLSFFGLSSLLHILPYKGEEIGYAGLLILLVATYILTKKVSRPYIC